jgi:hypothetical protein
MPVDRRPAGERTSVDPSCGMGGALHDPERRSVEWYTPASVFEALGLHFDLDPCAPVGGVPWLPATTHYTKHDDGLSKRWAGRVWLNPPYGREAALWVDRLVEHGNGIALVFSRTDARWFQRAAQAADAVCFIAGRLSFVPGTLLQQTKGHNAANGSVLLAYGQECANAVRQSELWISYGPHLSFWEATGEMAA